MALSPVQPTSGSGHQQIVRETSAKEPTNDDIDVISDHSDTKFSVTKEHDNDNEEDTSEESSNDEVHQEELDVMKEKALKKLKHSDDETWQSLLSFMNQREKFSKG